MSSEKPLEKKNSQRSLGLFELISSYASPQTKNSFELYGCLPSLSSALFSPFHQGQVVEWGIPYGKNGRCIPLSFFRNISFPVAWIYEHKGLRVYPPSWKAFGINLEQFFFVESKQPLQDLKPLFLCRTFPVIVMDISSGLFQKHKAFLKQKAHQHEKIIFIIHPFWMRKDIGNPYAQVRINVFFHFFKNVFSLDLLKGGQEQRLCIQSDEVFRYELFRKYY
ncbi:MAG: hypothetical protein KDD52_04270 [Bdellovibrionales bacterium]|nr:hypothetical protein [Bdellovibrionales bacterium]